MKFDVIVGNPPFKRGNETGGASSLWRKIVKTAWGLLKDGGTVAMITPQLANSSKDLGFIFVQYQTTTVWTKINQHFPGIGSTFYAWVVVKISATVDTNFVDENCKIKLTTTTLPNDLRAISLLTRLAALPKFECRSSPEYLHTSVADGNDDNHCFSTQTPGHPYVLRRTSGANYYMYGDVLPSDYYKPKVALTFSGNPHYSYHSKSNPIGTIKYQSGHILVNNKEEGENLIALYNTKPYLFIQGQSKSAGMKGKDYYELPVLPLTKKWTDEEVLNHPLLAFTDDDKKLINEYFA